MSGPQPGTPTPWLQPKNNPRKITGTGVLICTALLRDRGTTKSNKFGKGEEAALANAAAIVHRVNNWDELVEALDFMVNVSRSVSGFSPMARKQAEKALAKARGEA